MTYCQTPVGNGTLGHHAGSVSWVFVQSQRLKQGDFSGLGRHDASKFLDCVRILWVQVAYILCVHVMNASCAYVICAFCIYMLVCIVHACVHVVYTCSVHMLCLHIVHAYCVHAMHTCVCAVYTYVFMLHVHVTCACCANICNKLSNVPAETKSILTQ